MLMFCLTIFGTAEAARAKAELLNVSAYNLDRETVRIQIDYRGRLDSSDINLNVSGEKMILDLNDTASGRINRTLGRNIQATNIIDNVSMNNADKTRTQLVFSMIIDFDADGYTANLTADTSGGRNFSRLIIDVERTNKSAIYHPEPSYGDVYGNIDGDLSGRVITLDAGHGGSDNGAVGPSRLTEKEVTLAVALKVERMLAAQGAQVIMTRTTDVDVASPYASNTQELQARCDYANGAEMFISIHCNAFSNPQSNGMETFYSSVNSESYRLAALLNEELLRYGGLNNRGVKTANFYVIKHTACPSSLIELAFITNYEEERLLASDEYQERLAQAIVAAINRFFNGY
ncbi:MAG: N-acetylmuramoyl-L-alanine amidase [Selenomonadaceae bacterium]|nr:N-acetylmuramoyl-L-alanine amidase [Selenomonadaceae bacterium]